MTSGHWHLFTGTGDPHDGWASAPEPMTARRFDGGPALTAPRAEDDGAPRRLGTREIGAHQLNPEDLDVINAALICRRPLLVTGAPGLGKSTLAYLIARELELGPVLSWPITSRSTLLDGLYHYDALRRFEEARLPLPGDAAPAAPEAGSGADIADYLTLGPLGTALLPYDRPRVLLIDEIDKADVDLPNDLLHVFEDGEYPIPELRRMRAHRKKVSVATHGGDEPVEILEGVVRCRAFPIVIMTSNGERDFPPAFLRRCLRLQLADPTEEQLAKMVAAHLGGETVAAYRDVIGVFLERRRQLGALPADRLLIAIQILSEAARNGQRPGGEERERLARLLMQPLDPTG
jgi:MoxR-like ATPase